MSDTKRGKSEADDQQREQQKQDKRDTKDQKSAEKQERGQKREDAVARLTALGLHILEDIVYALTALVLVAGAFVVLGAAVYRLSTEVPDGATEAMEHTMEALLIVFILVELLSAVRTAIDEHTLVAEPFLLVGILAAIKEMVVLATFRIETSDPQDTSLKIGVLGAAVVALAFATFILRRREREPKESGDTNGSDEPAAEDRQ